MRYPASEKLEIIRIVEQSHLPAKLTLDKLGIARRTFYRWYDRFLEGGPEALEDRPVRRQYIRHNSRRKLAECGPRLGVDVMRRACGVASVDIRWSVV